MARRKIIEDQPPNDTGEPLARINLIVGITTPEGNAPPAIRFGLSAEDGSSAIFVDVGVSGALEIVSALQETIATIEQLHKTPMLARTAGHA